MKTLNTPKILFIISTLGLICAGLAIYSFQRESHHGHLTLFGNVDIRQVELGFRVGGRVLEMRYEEGDPIKAGDVLAKLDPEPFEQQQGIALAKLNESQATLAKMLAGNRPQEIQEARARLREKQVNYDNAQKTADRQEDLANKNFSSKQSVEDAQAAAKEAQAQLKTAQEALKLAEEGFRKEEIDAAKARVLASLNELESAQTHLEDTVLSAPNDGEILTRIREVGAIVASGDPVYALSLTTPVWIRCYVNEVELGRIKPGMQAEVFTDSDPDLAYQGQIGFISPQAEFTPKTVETTSLRTDLVYRLRIVVKDPNHKLRQGMPVTVKIKTAHG